MSALKGSKQCGLTSYAFQFKTLLLMWDFRLLPLDRCSASMDNIICGYLCDSLNQSCFGRWNWSAHIQYTLAQGHSVFILMHLHRLFYGVSRYCYITQKEIIWLISLCFLFFYMFLHYKVCFIDFFKPVGHTVYLFIIQDHQFRNVWLFMRCPWI